MRLPALFLGALAVALLTACTSWTATPAEEPTPESTGSYGDEPPGFEFAHMYWGGSWVKQPWRTPEDCAPGVDSPYCWTTTIHVEDGCAKGWAMTLLVLDSYGDRLTTYRERLESVPADLTFDHTFTMLADARPDLIDQIVVDTARCI